MRAKVEFHAGQYALFSHAAPYNLVLAGQGGGKSFHIGVLAHLFTRYCPKMVGIIAANTYRQLSDSTLKEVFDVWAKYFGITEYDAKKNPGGYFVLDKQPPEHFTPHGWTFKTNENKIFLQNGAVIMTAQLENYKSIEGTTVGWAILDETADTREAAVSEVITGRLRQRGLFVRTDVKNGFPFCLEDHEHKGDEINPLFIFTKPAKTAWLSEMFLLQEKTLEIRQKIYSKNGFYQSFDGIRQVLIYSAFLNQKNLPKNWLKNRIELLGKSGLVNSHIYGDPFAKTGGEFVKEFDVGTHLNNSIKFDKDYPIHFSIDFNAKPYMTGLVCQLVECSGDWNGLEDWLEIRVLDEYALETPRNSAGHLAAEFCEDYYDLCDMGVFVYGDASGHNSLPVKGTASFFDDFTQNLKQDLRYTKRVPKQNPHYNSIAPNSMGRASFVNKLFEGVLGVRVLIHPRCTHFIGDITNCKEDANGRMEKKKEDGVEKFGHHLDAFMYFVCHEQALAKYAKFKIN